MDLIIFGLLGLIVVIIMGAVVFLRYSQSQEHPAESNEERIEIRTIDHHEFTGRFHSARLIVDGKTVEFDHVRSIDNNAYGIIFRLAEGSLQYPYEQVDGDVAITVSGVSDPVVIPLNKVGYLFRKRLDLNA